MTEYSNITIADALDAIEDQCRPTFDHMPDLQADLLVGYLAQIRLAITLPEFPSMSVNDWERRHDPARFEPKSFGSILAEDPTYSEARYTAHEVQCPLCSAAPDDMCVTAAGRSTTKPHQGRIYARMRAITDQHYGIEALIEPLDDDDCNPHGIMRDAVDRALDQVADAAEMVRQERAAHAALAASSAEEVVVF